MSNAVVTTGILVRRALFATPTVFSTVGEITKVNPPGYSRNKIETTTHNDGTESYVLGILRQKDCTFSINFTAADSVHAAILADIQGNIKNQWQILFPSGIAQTGPARVQMFDFIEATVDGVQRADCALTWAGPIVQT